MNEVAKLFTVTPSLNIQTPDEKVEYINIYTAYSKTMSATAVNVPSDETTVPSKPEETEGSENTENSTTGGDGGDDNGTQEQ